MLKNTDTGFTLIEMLIAAAIFSIIMVALYSSFQSGTFGYKNIDEAVTVSQHGWQALERFSCDLRNRCAYSDKNTLFKGTSQEIHFLSLIDTYTDGLPRRSYGMVDYFASAGTFYRRCRYGKESLNEQSSLSADELLGDVQEVSFQYAQALGEDKHLEWKDAWEYKKEFPAAVKITLVSTGRPQEPFERVIYVP